jgi:hypothetical protein
VIIETSQEARSTSVMCGAGKHPELGTGQIDEIARHLSAEQAQQRDRVLGTDDSRATA